MQKGRKLKLYKKFLIIFSFFLLFSTNTFAKMNYLKCTEKIDKVRDHWLNEGDIDSIALMEYEDTKNTIKINMVFNLSKEKPFLHIKKRKIENTELGFQINISEKQSGLEMRESYSFVKLEDKIAYRRSAYFKSEKTSKNDELLLDHDNTARCENITKDQYKKLMKQKSWNFE